MAETDQSSWHELQNMYEMGLIGRSEYEKQRDLLLADGEDRSGELSFTRRRNAVVSRALFSL